MHLANFNANLPVTELTTHYGTDGYSFHEVFTRLVGRCGLSPRTAFGVVLRVFRGGGLTKDALYLAGLRDLLAWLRRGQAVEPLFVGKIGLQHVETVCALRERGLVVAPAVLPRYLWNQEGRERLARSRSLDVLDIARELAAQSSTSAGAAPATAASVP